MADNLPVENQGRIKAVEDRTDKIEVRIDRIAEDVSDIKTKLLNRPTLGMTTLISVLVCREFLFSLYFFLLSPSSSSIASQTFVI